MLDELLQLALQEHITAVVLELEPALLVLDRWLYSQVTAPELQDCAARVQRAIELYQSIQRLIKSEAVENQLPEVEDSLHNLTLCHQAIQSSLQQ